ncbi:NAD(+) kinase [Methylophilaceae bacterium]|nr:NAD(+) kinase [Methylophilaceae bacterium]
MKAFKKIAVIGKYPSKEESTDINSQLLQLVEHLSKKPVELFVEEKTQQQLNAQTIQAIALKDIGACVDLAIIIGGDGTMIGVARNLVDSNTPLVGVNQGRFGFLADLNTSSMLTNIDSILNGEYIEDKRMLINTKIIRDDHVVYESLSLNDIVIKSGVRLIELEVMIDNAFVHRQRSDGIIVSTPTGTTAYALSAGGPILHPNLDAISIVPISPHTLSNRPIAINAESKVTIKIVHMDESYASIDGQIKFPLDTRDVIEISKAKQSISILHPNDYCYFEMLRNKLHWG